MEPPDFPYYNTVDQIFHVEWSIPKLVRQELLRESIQTLWPNGHPTKLVHVAGTGGKGSTCRFLEMGFSTLGNAGSYMSPHLFDYRERFSINGEFVRREDVTEAWEQRIRPHNIRLSMRNAHHVHSVLESSILIALTLFEKYEVQWAAMETHLGGRYDPTRALDVEATLLTNVGSDHAHILGSEQWQRALDKAGIARTDVPFFTTERDGPTLDVIAAVCKSVQAPFYQIEKADVDSLAAQAEALDEAPIPNESLLGPTYQKWNACLALSTIRHLCPHLDETQVLHKFRNAQLPGRLWRVEPYVYADIAHNVEKLDALADELQKQFGDVGKILVIGASKQRLPLKLFPRIAPLARAIIVTGASFKGQSPEQVQREIQPLAPNTPTLVIAEPRQAFQVAKSMRVNDEIVFLTGSTYMIEQVLNPDPYARHINSTFGWRTTKKSEAHGTIDLTLPSSSFQLR